MMNSEAEYGYLYDAEDISEAFERDSRRYNKAFTEEEEAKLL